MILPSSPSEGSRAAAPDDRQGQQIQERSLSRRRFLALTSSSLASLWVGGRSRPAFAAPPSAWMSVGYLMGSALEGQLDVLADGLTATGGSSGRNTFSVLSAATASLRVRPAERLPLGDQRLAGATVEVRVLGLYPQVLDRTWFESALLEVLYPAPPELEGELGPGALLPHFAWSLGPRSAPAAAPPNRFRVPLGPEGGLHLRLTVVPGSGLSVADGEVWTFNTRFTVDWEAGVPRLHRGIYLLGLTPGTWDAPASLLPPGRSARPDLCSIVLRVKGSRG